MATMQATSVLSTVLPAMQRARLPLPHLRGRAGVGAPLGDSK